MATLQEVKDVIAKKLAEKDAEIAALKSQLAAAPTPAQLDEIVIQVNGDPGEEENPPK